MALNIKSITTRLTSMKNTDYTLIRRITDLMQCAKDRFKIYPSYNILIWLKSKSSIVADTTNKVRVVPDLTSNKLQAGTYVINCIITASITTAKVGDDPGKFGIYNGNDPIAEITLPSSSKDVAGGDIISASLLTTAQIAADSIISVKITSLTSKIATVVEDALVSPGCHLQIYRLS